MNSTHIRWMIRRDMSRVLAIENESFPQPWDEDQFLYCLRQRNCIGMVAERDDNIVGFMIYEIYKDRLNLLNLAVAADSRRDGVGAAMVAKLVGKLRKDSKNKIAANVCESNLGAQLFFKSQGFRAVSVIRDYYDDGQSAYAMIYRLGAQRIGKGIEINEVRR